MIAALAFALLVACRNVGVWRWSRAGSPAWLALAGALSGVAAATKLTGIVLLAAMAFWIAIRGKRPAREAGLYVAAGLAVAAPWYLKTWVTMGNPIWPFLSTLFGGRWDASFVAPAFVASYNWAGRDWTWLFLHQEPPTLLAAALLLSAAAWLQRRTWPPFIRFLWVPVIPYMLVAAGTLAVWRLSLPLMPAFALTVGWAVSGSRGKTRTLGALATAVCLAPVLWATQNNALFAVLGARSASQPELAPRTAYLRRSLDYYGVYEEANRTLPPSAKVLLFREEAGYYLEREYLWGNPTVQGVVAYARMRDAAQLRERFAELGVTHVLVNETFAVASASPGYYRVLGLLAEMLAGHAKPVARDGPVALYKLPKKPNVGLFQQPTRERAPYRADRRSRPALSRAAPG